MTTLEQAARALLAIADTVTAEREPWSLEDMRASADALRAALAAGQAQPVEGVVWGLYGEDSASLVQRGTEDDFIARRGGSRLYTAPPSQPVAPAGWKLVPVEPAEEMLRAGRKGRFDYMREAENLPFGDEAASFRAMLSASPPAPAVRPLTDEEFDSLHGDHVRIVVDQVVGLHAFGRAAIAEFCRVNGIEEPK